MDPTGPGCYDPRLEHRIGIKAMAQEQLLSIAAIIYGGLGGILVIAPKPFILLLGLPRTDEYFYVRLLGSGLVGTAIALVMEGAMSEPIGLSLPGLIAVTVTVVAITFTLLIVTRVTDKRRGRIFIWLASFTLFFACFIALTTLGRGS